jgi:hypothetical protein
VAAAGIAITDIDDTNIESATIVLTNASAGDVMSVGTLPVGISSSIVSGAGTITVTLTGSANLAIYQTVIQAVMFASTSEVADARVINIIVNDGSANSNTAVTTIGYTGVNDAPVTDLNGAPAGTGTTATFTEDGGPIVIGTAAATVTDVDSTNMTSMTVTLTNRPDGDALESLSLNAVATTAAAGLTFSYTAATGVLLIGGSATLATYHTILRGVQYNNTDQDPTAGARTINAIVNDGVATSAINTSTVTVVAVNDAPITNADTVISNVGASTAVVIPTAWLLANDTDAESDIPSTITGVGGNSGGTVSGPASGNVTFTDNATLDGSFTYQANDGTVSGAAATVTVDNSTIATTTLVGGAGSEIFIAGGTNDTIRGGGGNDFINGAGGTDLLDFSDGTAGITFTMVQSASDTVANLSAAGLGTDTYRNMEGVIGTSFGDAITASAAGGIINSGAGADIVNINATTNGSSWTVDLGSDTAADKIIFNHASLGLTHNTVATVSNFNVAHDKIAINLNGAPIANGGFIQITGDATDVVSQRVIELFAISLATASLASDGNDQAVEQQIRDAIDDIAAGTYTVIVYGASSGTTDAGIYTMTVTATQSGNSGGNSNLGTGSFNIEHIMTLNGIAAGSLDGDNFVAAADPIVLDLDHNGVSFSSLGDGVYFDINGDGAQDQIAWTANGGDGILVLDVDGSGKIENGNELFTPTFNGGNFADGIAALASLDDDHDGVIDSQDATFGNLMVWRDANHDGVSDGGELVKLGELGIESIGLATTPGAPIDGQNIAGIGSFTYADGTTGTFVEVDLDASLGTLEFDDGGGDLDLSALDTVAAGVTPPQQPQGGEAPVADAGSTVPAAIAIMHEQAQLAMQLAAS